MSPGFIILLNGCSSSGKTSLAHALQKAAPDLHLLHVSLDAFRSMEPQGYWAAEDRSHWPARLAALCHAINATTKQYTSHGQNVILDHVLSKEAWNHLRGDLRDESMYLVRVHCSLALAEAREAQRPDRAPGLARTQWESVHLGRDYDFTVDTSTMDSESAAAMVLTWFRGQPRPAALGTKQGRFRAA
jgi:chloramphenicol 3-O phosphotransferase